jgi:hypothetical protein
VQLKTAVFWSVAPCIMAHWPKFQRQTHCLHH